MRRINPLFASAMVALSFCSHAAEAQLPPPPPPNFPDYVHLLESAYNSHDVGAYGKLFAPDLKVFKDGSLVASDLAAYLSQIKGEFKRNLHMSVHSWAQGSQLLMFQEMNGCISEASTPQIGGHSCTWSMAVRYDLGNDHKIVSVHILEADGTWNIHPGSQ